MNKNLSYRLYAAGSNAKGQLAIGSEDDAHTFTPCLFHSSDHSSNRLPPDTELILSLAAGGNHTLLLLSCHTDDDSSRRELWGCGDSSKGQLGPSNEINTTSFQPIDLRLEAHGFSGYTIARIAACWETSFVVLAKAGASDVLLSMGGNDFGDLGIGASSSRTKGNWPFHVVDLERAAGERVRSVAVLNLVAGPHHVVVRICAQYEDGTARVLLVGWGTARHGQLGPILLPSGRPASFVSHPHAVSLSFAAEDIAAFALGNQHTVLLHSSGQLTGLGSDKKGQLSGLKAVENARQIGCTWNGTYILVGGGDGEPTLLSGGSRARGQLGHTDAAASLSTVQFPVPARPRGFACGSEHVLVLATTESDSEPEVWGWGWNEHGNLGTGSLEDVHVPVRIWPPALGRTDSRSADEEVCGIWAGCGTSWIAVRSASTPVDGARYASS